MDHEAVETGGVGFSRSMTVMIDNLGVFGVASARPVASSFAQHYFCEFAAHPWVKTG